MDAEVLDGLIAAWSHEGRAAELVCDLKYSRSTVAVSELAEAMAPLAPPADLVVWVPASRARRRQRGFDQGELLARAVARRCGLPVRRGLRRVDDVAQTARAVEGRRKGPRLAHAGRRYRGAPLVLLIDDVCTTGSSLRAGAAVLRAAGAGGVVALVATRALPKVHAAPGALGVYHRGHHDNPGG